MKEWHYIKPLNSDKRISEAEEKLRFEFNESYADVVKKYNGGRPPISSYDTQSKTERTIKSFLSLNPEDSENVFTADRYVSEISKDLIPFAIDNFGNYICFERNSESIIFLDFETGVRELVSESFSDFINILEADSE